MAADTEMPPVSEAADSSDDGDGSSSSGSDVEDAAEADPTDMQAIMDFESALQDNPNLYDTHMQYIATLRKCGLKARLSEARRAMHERFPLTETLWLEWLADEAQAAQKKTARHGVKQLISLAVEDYLSVPVWKEALRYSMESLVAQQNDGAAVESTRALCEQALTAGGLHVTEGSQLWDTYREWEEQLLDDTSKDGKQVERVRKLYHRQLQVPLATGAATLAAYTSWEEGLPEALRSEVPAHVRQGHAKAMQAVEVRRGSEAAVAPSKPADADLLAAFMAYVKLEEAHGDPARVQVIYERAVARFAVTHYLWQQYARYLETHLNIPAVITRVYARAVRNCPWTGTLWARYLNAMERTGAPDAEHAELFSKAVNAGLQTPEDYMEVILARTDAVRRRTPPAPDALRAAFKSGSELMQAYFPEYLDRAMLLTAYWADCEANLADDLKAARAVWEAALKTVAGRYVETWAAYISFERGRRHIREARALYKRGYSRRLQEGGQPLLCQAWLRFEREEGSAEDYLQACLKVEPILAEAEAAAAAAADAEAAAAAKAAVEKAPQLSREEMVKLRQQRDPNFHKKQAAQQAAAAAKPSQPSPSSQAPAASGESGKKRRGLGFKEERPKRARTDTAPAPQTSAHPSPSEAAAPPEPGAVAQAAAPSSHDPAPIDATKSNAQSSGNAAANGGPAPQAHPEPTTAFVKGIEAGVEDLELQQLFQPCGALKGIRHMCDAEGRSRGFAYVEFESRQGLEQALQLNGTQLRQRPLLVLESRPPKPRPTAPQAGGRGGRFGGRGGGRGDGGGRGHGRGEQEQRGGPVSGLGGGAGWGEAGRQHQRMDLSAAAKPLTAMLPRAIAAKKSGDAEGPPKSNADFRSMLLKKGG